MPIIERKKRVPNTNDSLPTPRPLLRTVAAGCVGLTLLGAAYQAAFALSPVAQAGTIQGYGPPPGGGGGGDDDDDGGLSTGEKVAIGIGAAAVLYFVATQTGIIGGKDDDAAETTGTTGQAASQAVVSALPTGHMPTQVKLIPQRATLTAGTSGKLFLAGKSGVDGKWYDLTNNPATSFELKAPAGTLVKQSGSKNVVCLPLSTPQAMNGKTVKVVGTFALSAGKKLTASRALAVQVL